VSVAPTKTPPAANAPDPDTLAARDPLRAPKVRHAMHLIIPREVTRGGVKTVTWAKLTITESKAGGVVALDVDNDGIGVKKVELGIAELATFADMLNRIRRRVVDRKEWRP